MQNDSSLTPMLIDNYLENSLHWEESCIEINSEEDEDKEFVSDIIDIIKAFDNSENNEKLTTINNFIPNSNKYKHNSDHSRINRNQQSFLTYYTTQKKVDELEAVKIYVKNMQKAVNKIISETGNKIKITKKNLDVYFEKNSLEEIKKKKWKKIFASLHKNNLSIIKNTKKALKGRIGHIAFRVLMKLTFEEMSDYYLQDCKLIVSGIHLINLTGKFNTLKDVMKKRNKKLRQTDKSKNEIKSNRINAE